MEDLGVVQLDMIVIIMLCHGAVMSCRCFKIPRNKNPH
jgi:hypothetical protein